MTMINSASSNTSQVRALSTLTSLRFLAAFTVFIWHSRTFSKELDKYQFGYVGVGFFFLLSGFILTYVYFERLKSNGRSNLMKYFVSRLAKLYPLHLVTFFLSLPLILKLYEFTLTTENFLSLLGLATLNLGLVQSYFSVEGIHFSFNSVSWSISTEMFFYIMFPLLLHMLSKKFNKLRTAHLLVGALFIWTILFIYLSKIRTTPDQWFDYVFPLMRLPDFIIGMLAGAVFIKIQQIKIKVTPSGRKLLFTLLELLVMVLIILAVKNMPNVQESLKFGVYLLPFWFSIVLVFAFQEGLLSNILLYKPFIYLGSISFAFYMSHQLVLRYIAWIGIEHKTAYSLIISLGISMILYRLIELPAQKVISDGFGKLQNRLSVKKTS